MDLKGFHIVFIVAATALAFLFGSWCLRDAQAHGSAGTMVAGVVSIGCGLGLIGYGAWFLRKMRRLS